MTGQKRKGIGGMLSNQKTAIFVAGSNGSGKSTLIAALAENGIFENFVHINPDIIVKEAGVAPSRKNYVKAYREADERLQNALSDGVNILRESVTMSPRKIQTIKDFGYEVFVLFIGTSDPMINVLNVANRVKNGGHSVPIETILARHAGAIKNVLNVLDFVDCVVVFDNSYHDESPTIQAAITGDNVCFEADEDARTEWHLRLLEQRLGRKRDLAKEEICHFIQKSMDSSFQTVLQDEGKKYIDLTDLKSDNSITQG